LLAAFAAVLFALREGFLAEHGATLRGDLLGVLAGLFWGLTTVVIRITRLTQISAEKLLFYQLAASAVLMPLLSQGLGEVWQWQFSAFAIGSLLVQAVLVAFISYLVWMWMLGRYPATQVSVFVFFTPLFALLFGALWLGEPVTPGLLLALTMVAVGIVLVNRRSAVAKAG
jgi:drug/metabolite transporter (DMT)-like permease